MYENEHTHTHLEPLTHHMQLATCNCCVWCKQKRSYYIVQHSLLLPHCRHIYVSVYLSLHLSVTLAPVACGASIVIHTLSLFVSSSYTNYGPWYSVTGESGVEGVASCSHCIQDDRRVMWSTYVDLL